MTPKYAHLLDRTVRYLEAGEGRPIILLHAFPLSADQWLPQLHRVPPGWRLIAPDVRGFRGTGQAYQDVGLDSATMATHAADVLALMNHLDLDRAVVGGLSMGGYITLAVARVAAGRLDGVVLADTKAPADNEAGRAARDAMIALVQDKGVGAVADAMLPKLLGATSQAEQPELTEVLRRLILQNTPEAVASAVRTMKGRDDATAWLSSIACPTLVICGVEDVLTPPSESEAMANAIPQAQLVLLPRAGHLSNLEAPMAFTEALAQFLGPVS
ncbi:MAG TPA: alpha/beta fold hydrolase [Vicinamibacterales bacterium]|nr:alpha/beta fold hydrolase [Vicinamibacterales bacterium]